MLLAFLAMGVAAVVTVTHRRALTARALSMNDGDYVTQNDRVQNPSWAHAGRFLREVRRPTTVQGYYQPLAMMSLMLDTAMGGRADDLRPYHRTSLVLHVANTVLLVALVHLLFGRPGVAALVGLIFGTHPMTVEPVAWLGERKTLLATFFALGCLVLYVAYTRRKGRGLYAACLTTFVLALMAKPTVTPMPILLLLLDYWPLRRLSGRAVVEKLPLFAIAGASAVITVISQRHIEFAATRPLSFPETVLLACHNVVFYPCKMMWPSNLSSVYPFPEPIDLSNGIVLIGVIGTVVLIAALLVSLRWTRALVAGCLFFLLALSPTLVNIAYALGVAADKYAYFPAVGVLLILAWGLIGLWNGPWPRVHPVIRRAAVVGAVAVVTAAQARATHRYLACWRDTATLSRHILAIAPDTSWVHNQLGYSLLEQRDVIGAIRHCRKAVDLDPRSPKAHVNLGLALFQRGHHEDAIAHFETALRLKPDLAEAHNNLGIALVAARRDFARAADHFKAALQAKPDSPEVHFNLALALAAQMMTSEAIAHFERALELRPEYPEAHFKLADLLAQLGRGQEAIPHYYRALQSNPQDPGVHTNLGIALARQGQTDLAIEHLRKALALRPDDARMHNNLGRALVENGQIDEGIQCYHEALRREQSYVDARHNLAAACDRLGRTDEAVAQLREILRIDPGRADNHCTLADLLARQRRFDEALVEYRAALAIDPNHAQARAGIDAVTAAQNASSRPG